MKKTTIRDVAKEAGVSITIASFALNNVKGRVSPETRERVLECAKRLGYIPNTFAQNLRTRNSKTIGLIYDEVYFEERNPSTLQFVSGAIRYAGEMGRDILVKLINMETDLESQIREYIGLWDSGRVSGLILQSSRTDPGLIEEFKKKDINFVIIPATEKINNCGVNSVFIDNYKLMKEGIGFIHGKGYDEVHFLTLGSETVTEREAGFTDAIRELGLSGGPLYYRSRYRGKGEIWETIKKVVQNRKNRIAIACWNDVDAINIIDILHSQNIKIPQEVGVMGFDDIPASEHTYPPLTTIRQQFEKMAQKAVDILIYNCDDNNGAISTEIHGEIVVRGSI